MFKNLRPVRSQNKPSVNTASRLILGLDFFLFRAIIGQAERRRYLLHGIYRFLLKPLVSSASSKSLCIFALYWILCNRGQRWLECPKAGSERWPGAPIFSYPDLGFGWSTTLAEDCHRRGMDKMGPGDPQTACGASGRSPTKENWRIKASRPWQHGRLCYTAWQSSKHPFVFGRVLQL